MFRPSLILLSLCLLLAPQQAEGQALDDYLEAVITALNFDIPADQVIAECDCLIGAINNNSCPYVCDALGCEAIIDSIVNCTNYNCPAAGICRLGLSSVNTETNCPLLGSVFAENTTFCANPTISSFLGTLTLHDDLRAACGSVNALIADEATCQNLCGNAPGTCAEYLGELSVCAKIARDRPCFDAILALRTNIIEENFNCQNFNEIDGACDIVHTPEGAIDFAAMTFDNLLPVDFGVVLSGRIGTECTCVMENLADCSYVCQATDQCNALELLLNCANTTVACDATSCHDVLADVLDFATNTSCFEVDPGIYNCSDYGFAPIECSPWYDQATCEALIDDVVADKPVFSNLPTASQTPSPSITPSQTGSNAATPSQTPSTGTSPSSGSSPAATIPVSTLLATIVALATWFAVSL